MSNDPRYTLTTELWPCKESVLPARRPAVADIEVHGDALLSADADESCLLCFAHGAHARANVDGSAVHVLAVLRSAYGSIVWWAPIPADQVDRLPVDLP
jgi:hypothetical protein